MPGVPENRLARLTSIGLLAPDKRGYFTFGAVFAVRLVSALLDAGLSEAIIERATGEGWLAEEHPALALDVVGNDGRREFADGPTPCNIRWAANRARKTRPLPATRTRRLGSQGLEVSSIGLGLMGMSYAYGTPRTAMSASRSLRSTGRSSWA